MSTFKDNYDSAEKQKIISSLTLMDDLFMKVVLQDSKCTEFILQTIMNNTKLKLKKQVLQKNLSNLHGHSLILDCLCEDETNNIYNIEIQNNISGAQPKRARYHAALLDMHSLKRGNDFTQLPWSYVIFPTLTVYIVKKPYKSLKSSGLQSFFLCYQMCVQIFIL